MTSVDNGKGAYGPDVRGEKRYLVWVCEGCDSCDPPDGSERSPFPCTHESPSVNGMWVVQAAQAEAHERDLRHEAYDRLKDQGCLLCGKGPVQPAHLIDRQMLADGQEHELAVIPLCALHHRGYDDGTLSVLESLEPYHRDVLAYAVQRFGLISTLERVTNQRWRAREDRAA